MKVNAPLEFAQLAYVWHFNIKYLNSLLYGIFLNFLDTNVENNFITNTLTPNQLMQVFEYFIRKMCSDSQRTNDETLTLYIRIFYDVLKSPPFISDVLDEFIDKRNDIKLAFTIVPVCGLQSNFDLISMIAIRHEWTQSNKFSNSVLSIFMIL